MHCKSNDNISVTKYKHANMSTQLAGSDGQRLTEKLLLKRYLFLNLHV